MRSPVDEISRKNKCLRAEECSFPLNSVISQCISKVDTSKFWSRAKLSNAVSIVVLQQLHSKLFASKLLFYKVCAFSAQVAQVMCPRVHRTSGDRILSKLIPLQALDLQLQIIVIA